MAMRLTTVASEIEFERVTGRHREDQVRRRSGERCARHETGVELCAVGLEEDECAVEERQIRVRRAFEEEAREEEPRQKPDFLRKAVQSSEDFFAE